jgi:hypothetical protein
MHLELGTASKKKEELSELMRAFSNKSRRRHNKKLLRCAHCLFNASIKLPLIRRRSIMSSASFWSNACKQATGKPLQTLLDAAHGSCGATVRRARAADCALLAAV